MVVDLLNYNSFRYVSHVAKFRQIFATVETLPVDSAHDSTLELPVVTGHDQQLRALHNP